MAQVVLIGVCVVVISVMTWGTGRLIDSMRSRERVAERLLIDDCQLPHRHFQIRPLGLKTGQHPLPRANDRIRLLPHRKGLGPLTWR